MKQQVSRPRTDGIFVGRRPPDTLSDGRVTVRLPRSDDVLRVVGYGRDESLLQGVWIAGPFPDSDVEAWAQDVIAQARDGWTKAGGIHGGGLVIDEEQSFVGMLYLTPTDDHAVEISYGVAPSARGRGIATRALRLITAWAVTETAFANVELRISEDHVASRRVAEKAGFHFQEQIETYIESTGQTYIEVLYSLTPNL